MTGVDLAFSHAARTLRMRSRLATDVPPKFHDEATHDGWFIP